MALVGWAVVNLFGRASMAVTDANDFHAPGCYETGTIFGT